MSAHIPIPNTDLEAYACGRLDGSPRYAVISAHLAGCPECNDALELVREGLVAPPAVPASLHAEVAAIGRRMFGPHDAVGDCTIIEQVGEGGQGQVYAAWNRAERRYQAIKFRHRAAVEPAPVADPDATHDLPMAPHELAAELQAAVRLQLPHFIRVHGLKRECGDWFIAMELAVGKLGEARWRAVGVEQIVRWLLAVAEDVDLANQQGLCHYDIKPDNVLLVDPTLPPPPDPLEPDLPEPGATGRLKPALSDFGLAHLRGRECGSPGYAAPEQFGHVTALANAVEQAGKIDGFGLAATICDMATGFAPGARPGVAYRPPTAAELVKRGLDHDLAAVLAKQLAAKPRDRYASVSAFAADLRRWLTGEPVAACERGRVRRQLWWAFRKQERWVQVGIPALLLALIVAAGITRSKHTAEVQAREDKLAADALAAQKGKEAADRSREAAEKGKEAADAVAVSAKLELQIFAQQTANEKNKLATEQTAAAQASARRGDWPAAMRQFAAVIREADPPTARRLRVERLFGFFAVNDLPSLDRELTALEADDLGPLAAQVRLVRGMHCLCHDGRAAEGRAHLTAALCESNRLLTPADVAYAESLAETRPAVVLEKLRAAVRLDALHYPAQMSLTLALLAAGQLDAAGEQCAQVESLFPGAHATLVARGLIAALHGNRDEMRKSLALYADRTGVDIKRMAAFFELFADALDVLVGGDNPLMPIPPQQAAALRKQVAGMAKLALEAGPLGLPDPAVAWVLGWSKDLFGMIVRVMRNPFDPQLPGDLERACQDSPESMYRTLAAFVHMIAALVNMKSGKPPETLRAIESAADYAHAAAAAESIFARGPTRYLMLGVGACMDQYVLKLNPHPKSVHLTRLGRTLPRLVAEGAKWPDAQEKCVWMAVIGLAEDVNPSFTKLWDDMPDGAAARLARFRQLYHLAKPVLDAAALALRDGRKVGEWGDKLEFWAEFAGIKDGRPARAIAPPPRAK